MTSGGLSVKFCEFDCTQKRHDCGRAILNQLVKRIHKSSTLCVENLGSQMRSAALQNTLWEGTLLKECSSEHVVGNLGRRIWRHRGNTDILSSE